MGNINVSVRDSLNVSEVDVTDVDTTGEVSKLFTNASYCSVADANDYFEGRFPSDVWDQAINSDKAKALLSATRSIDRLNFSGQKTNYYNQIATALVTFGNVTDIPVLVPEAAYPTTPIVFQPLEFPRNGSKIVPEDIIVACCEIAYSLLDGVDIDYETNNIRILHQGFSQLRQGYAENATLEHIRAGIISITAWNRLKPYLNDPRSFRFARA